MFTVIQNFSRPLYSGGALMVDKYGHMTQIQIQINNGMVVCVVSGEKDVDHFDILAAEISSLFAGHPQKRIDQCGSRVTSA